MYCSYFFTQSDHPLLFYTYCPLLTAPSSFLSASNLPPNLSLPENYGTPEKPSQPQLNTDPERGLQAQNRRQSRGAVVERRRSSKRRNYRNKSKLMESAKKNCESNIVNHIFGFLSRNRQSERILQKTIAKMRKPEEGREKIKHLFFDCLGLMNLKRERKYINRRTLLSFFTEERLLEELPLLAERVVENGVVSLKQLCYLFRVCIYYFIRTHSHPAILTSKRIEMLAKTIHLRRRTFIQQQIQSQT